MEPATGIIQFHIALRHAYPNAIVDKLFDVSDPSSANYGKHWNREELMRHAQPVDGAAKRVTNWLHAADIIGCLKQSRLPYLDTTLGGVRARQYRN